MLNRYREEYFINLNPIQAGGKTNSLIRKVATNFVDGYSICDYCAGALHRIEKPPVCKLIIDLAKFLGTDEVVLTHGAREGKFMVMNLLLDPGDVIIIDSNRHYSTYVATEGVKARVYEVPCTSYPYFEITPDAYEETIKEIIKKEGTSPKLALLTHVDGDYGNLTNALEISSICKKYEIPFLLNAAYTAGRMKVNAKELGVDFLVCSCHKSFGIPGPLGILGISEKYKDIFLKKSEKYPKKDISLLGCTSRSASTATLIETLPHLENRVENYEEEVEKARFFVERMESLGEIKQIGVKPKKHDLIRLETPFLYEMGLKHRKKGYFLYEELQDRGITGLTPGQTKWFKISTYGLTWKQVKYLVGAFEEIVHQETNNF
ncbi:MAG: O-phospho-L-seryl-tRNA:Cys-tRNA synthase [bacterium]|nr:O-phospho-L-seryl-tRNA:Cys-tRNA synthase [bacterium]